MTWFKRQSTKKKDKNKSHLSSNRSNEKKRNDLWDIYTKEAIHNFKLFLNTSANLPLKIFTSNEIQNIQMITNAKYTLQSIWTFLKQRYSDLKFKISDLYNLRGHFCI